MAEACSPHFDRVVAIVRREGTSQCRGAIELAFDLASADQRLDSALAAQISGEATQVVFFSNAATMGGIARTGAIELAVLADAINVNYLAAARITGVLVRALAPATDRLTIVDVSSGAAHQPIAGWSAYCASKAAATMFFQCLAADHPDVRVRHFDPGVMDTGMQAGIRSSKPDTMREVQAFRDLHERGELQSPQDVAQRLLRELVG